MGDEDGEQEDAEMDDVGEPEVQQQQQAQQSVGFQKGSAAAPGLYSNFNSGGAAGSWQEETVQHQQHRTAPAKRRSSYGSSVKPAVESPVQAAAGNTGGLDTWLLGYLDAKKKK